MKGMELRTERLVIREFRLDDNEQLITTHQTKKRSPATSLGDQTRRPTLRRISSRSLAMRPESPRTSFTLAVATLDDELIGVANLAITGEASTGELAYVLSRESWGHGYATEVARRLIVFGFDELGLRRITAMCHPDNFASARVLEKAGMRFGKNRCETNSELVKVGFCSPSRRATKLTEIQPRTTSHSF